MVGVLVGFLIVYVVLTLAVMLFSMPDYRRRS